MFEKFQHTTSYKLLIENNNVTVSVDWLLLSKKTDSKGRYCETQMKKTDS